MPEDSKNHPKKANKGKNDPKEQRRPRQGRQQNQSATAVEKREEKANTIATSKAPEKPAYVDPGPEFYKNLKRETDEILKITEEANSKYKKKEIQSNWAKYEMPIESYEEIDEQDMGADYQKLAETPLSIGGHFQFKHEKSWDINTEPSLYDKYFEIDMDSLAIAIQTIPFHERNCIDLAIFTETDVQNMQNRSLRFKQKYFKNQSYEVPELQIQDKILNSLRESNKSEDENSYSIQNKVEAVELENSENIKNLDVIDQKNVVLKSQNDEIDSALNQQDSDEKTKATNKDDKNKVHQIVDSNEKKISNKNHDLPLNEIKLSSVECDVPYKNSKLTSAYTPGLKTLDKCSHNIDIVDDIDDIIIEKPSDEVSELKVEELIIIPITTEKDRNSKITTKDAIPVEKQDKNPAIESPEVLEKWLDDFLDS